MARNRKNSGRVRRVCENCQNSHTYFVGGKLSPYGANDARILQDFIHLNAADLANAWAYAEAHPEEIEAARIENEAA